MNASGQQRKERIQDGPPRTSTRLADLRAALNVLMLSGYWPVVGAGVAVASKDGPLVLLIPEDESDLATSSWADDVRTFKPGSLENLATAAEAIAKPLAELAWRVICALVSNPGVRPRPASYAAMHLYGGRMRELDWAPVFRRRAGLSR